MRALATGALLAAIPLVGSPAMPHIASQAVMNKINPIVSDERRELLTTKDPNRALLGIMCADGRQQLLIYAPKNLGETIDVRYRIDDQPQKSAEFKIDSSNTVSLRNLPPIEIGYARRVSIELIRYERPALLFNFRTVGANGIVKTVSCGQ